jgi:predicted ester cyclase
MTGAVRRERAKEEQIRVGVRRVIEAYNTNNPDLLDKTIAPDCVTHTPPYPDIKGLAATKQYARDTLTAYPDFHITTRAIIVEGNWAGTLWSWTGTHKDTGKKVEVTGARITKWVDGKCVEHWRFMDNLGLQEQLGFKLVPAEK